MPTTTQPTYQQREHQTAVANSISGLFLALDKWGQSAQSYVADYLETAVERFLGITLAHLDSPSAVLPSAVSAAQNIASKLSTSWRSWKEFSERTQLLHNLPDDTWWDALAELPPILITLSYPLPTPLEPLPQLVKLLESSPGGRMQICRMYGFQDEHGNPQPQWIEEELAKPGSRTDPKTGWKHPIARRHEAQSAADLAELTRILTKAQSKRGRLEKTCPESIDQLVAQGVLMPQVVRMTHKTEEQIRAECERNGWPVPATSEGILGARSPYEKELKPEDAARFEREQGWRHPERVLQSQSQSQPQPAEAATAVESDTQTVEQRIVSLFQSGGTPASIAKELQPEGVSKQKVAAIIKRFEDDPEAFMG